MTTTVDYALMAGHAYRSTRDLINWFPSPQGWTPFFPVPDPSTATAFPVSMGFEAVAFLSGNQVVISYAGTATLVDWDANLALGNGVLQAQLVQAAEYYLAIKAAVPGATITLTGHSLGGGLAALIGVMFGEQAVTFDQAPFASAALATAPALKAALLAKGFTPDQLAVLSGYIELRDGLGAFSSVVPNAHLVTNNRVNGEALGATYLAKNPIGTLVEDISNTSPGVSGIELHSQALLTAFLQSKETAATGKALNEVTSKLPDLLKMIFDSNLFANDPTKADKNFLENLVRHESGVRDPVSGAPVITADAMVTRFTKDLWKLAQDGGLTLTDGIAGNPAINFLSKTLTAFAMQFYYENSTNATNQTKYLFSDVPGGVQFDMADVSKDFATAFTNNTKPDLAKAKGLDYAFNSYLASSAFTGTERSLIKSMLPYLRDWYVQAGTGGLAITDVLGRGAFMLDGTASDTYIYQTGDGRLRPCPRNRQFRRHAHQKHPSQQGTRRLPLTPILITTHSSASLQGFSEKKVPKSRIYSVNSYINNSNHG